MRVRMCVGGVCIYAHTRTDAQTHRVSHTHARTRTHIFAQKQAFTRTHTYARSHTHKNSHIHTYRYLYVWLLSSCSPKCRPGHTDTQTHTIQCIRIYICMRNMYMYVCACVCVCAYISCHACEWVRHKYQVFLHISILDIQFFNVTINTCLLVNIKSWCHNKHLPPYQNLDMSPWIHTSLSTKKVDVTKSTMGWLRSLGSIKL